MAKTWAEVSESEQFKGMAPDQQEAARTQYFDQVVAPKVPQDQLSAVRAHFDSDTKPAPERPLTQAEYDKRSFWEKVGGPKPGETPSEFKRKVEAVDTPFPDILPGGTMLANAVAREGGGLSGLAPAIAKGAKNVGKDVLDTLGAPVKYLLRGGEANVPAMQQNIATFKAAGAEPSVGQAAGQRTPQALESLLGKTPGSAGRIYEKATEQQAGFGREVESLADSLSKTATPSVAGRTIEKGLSGEGGFVSRFKEGQKSLYDKLDTFIPSEKAIDVSATRGALASMNQDIKGAEALSKWFQNAKIKGIEEALKKDVAGPAGGVMIQPPGMYSTGKKLQLPPGSPTNELPYEAVKKLRTLVGQELEGGSLAADVPRSKWKALYAALSKDLEGAAVSTGNKDAVQAMNRANAYSKAGYDRIESVLDKVTKAGTPEQIFKSAVNSADMEAGATKISSIMKSLEPTERDVVRSAFIRRMGRAAPGQQSAEGDIFSSQTFLSNWNRMSPQAKSVMFASGEGNDLRKSLDSIAQTSEKIKEGSKVFSNPSGTTPAAALAGVGGAAAGSVVAAATGNLAPGAMLLTGAAATNLTARLMTNPKFVSWLSKAAKLPQDQLSLRMPGLINMLRANLKDQPDDVKQDADSYIEGVTGTAR